MAVTQRIAIDEIQTRLNEAWKAGAQAASGATGVPPLLWEETSRDNLPDEVSSSGQPWGRVRITHHASRQRTVAVKRFEQIGLILVECFVPEQFADYKGKAGDLADLVIGTFEGQRTTNVEFREVTPMEAGRVGLFFQIDVHATFKYHRTR